MADKEQIILEIRYDTDEAERNIQQLTSEIVKLEKEQKDLKGGLKQTDDQLKKNNTTRSQLNAQLAKNKTAMQKSTAERKKLIQSVQANKNSIDGLMATNNQLIAQSRKLDLSTKKGREEFQRLSKQINQNQATLKKFDAMQGRHQRNVGNYPNIIGNAKQALIGFASGFVGVTAAISGLIKGISSAININREFEQSFTNVLTLLDKAEKVRFGDMLERGAIDLMADFGLEIQDVNQALFDAISAGVPAGEAVEFLRKNAELAIGGVTSLGTAVDGTTTVLNAFGLSIEDTERVTSAFFAAQVEGKTNVDQLASSIGKIAPIAQQAGASFEDTLAALALLTKQGISTDESVTALKATMTAIIKPSVEAEKKFKQLGISTGAAALQQEGFVNIFKQVIEATEKDKDALAELIPNIRALTGAGALGTEQLTELDEIVRQLNVDFGEGSSLQEAFAEQMETGAKQAEIMRGQWRALMIDLGGGESIWKKIGTAVRDEFNKKISNARITVENFRIVWNEFGKQFTLANKIKKISEDYKELMFNIAATIKERKKAAKEAVEIEKQKQEELTFAELEARQKREEEEEKRREKEEKRKEEEREKRQREFEARMEKAQTDFERTEEQEEEFELQRQLRRTKNLELQRQLEIAFAKERYQRKIKQENLLDKEIEVITKKHNLEIAKINQKYIDLNIEAEVKKAKDEEEIWEETTRKQQMEMERRLQVVQGFAIEAGEALGNFLTQIDMDFEKFGQALILETLNFLEKEVLMAIASATASALASPESVATAGAAGIAKAAILAGLIKAAFTVAKSAVMKGLARGGEVPVFAGGGEMQTGIFTGKRHSGGGTNILDDKGNFLANVEKDERFFVMNRNATDYINTLSNINQRYGGRSFDRPVKTAQEGGEIASALDAQEVANALAAVLAENPPIVRVESIKTGIEDYDNVIDTSVV